MLSKSLILCFLVISGVLASEDGVYEWNDNDFVSELERHENTLVMFYAPWCGHSMHLMHKYAEAAELLKGNEPSITFAKIDCIKTGRKTCEKHSIRGYPTLKIFAKSDMVSNYNGPREANAIAKYMKTFTATAASTVRTPSRG